MDARTGENNTPTKLGKERINARLNRRKEAIQKILFETRPTSTLQKEQTFPTIMNTKEEPEVKPSEESRPYPNTTKPNPGGAEEGVGSANLQTITKDNFQVTDAFTVICSDI